MKSSFESPRRVAALSLALFAGALPLAAVASARNIKKSSVCTGVWFAARKGGPGLVDMSVFPIMKDYAAPDVITGEVVRGNDKGATISTKLDDFPGAGEFAFTWNESSHKTQDATVSLSVESPGYAQLQQCPETTLHFDPNNFQVSPGIPIP